MNTNELIFNQTLHGYQDGHSLISSSVELDNDIKRIMLPISDLSGATLEQGFEEYITGYPIKEANIYAIGKTWYASEMRRPGCVWTHTLLINFSDLSKVLNLKLLYSLFKRPDVSGITIEHYSQPIRLTGGISDIDDNEKTTIFTSFFLNTIFKTLYDGFEQPVFIRTTHSTAFDFLFLMLWRQQWPRLKRHFSFSTGSISPRSLKGKLLDLQVVPNSSDSLRILPSAVKLHMLDYTVESTILPFQSPEKWIETATSDLREPSDEIRRFLNLFGSDITIKRSSFRHLLRTYHYLVNNTPKLENVVEFLSEEFPTAKEATNLKTAVLGQTKNPFPSIIPRYNENSVLYFLSTDLKLEKFDLEKLNYRARFVSYFSNSNENVIELLKAIINRGPNEFAESAITDLALNINFSKNLDLILADKQLAPIFVTLNPMLAVNKHFWLLNSTSHSEIVKQLATSSIERHGWQEIVDILIEIESDTDLYLFENLNVDVAGRLLENIDRLEAGVINSRWKRYLENHETEVLEWLKLKQIIRTDTAKIVTTILNPNASLTVSYGIEPWIRFFENAESTISSRITSIDAFCLALAFNIDDNKAQRIFELCFENIYFSLYNDKLDYYLWKDIEVHTKALSFWKDWDKCKKLVNAVVDTYLSMGWSINKLIVSVVDNSLRERLTTVHKKRK